MQEIFPEMHNLLSEIRKIFPETHKIFVEVHKCFVKYKKSSVKCTKYPETLEKLDHMKYAKCLQNYAKYFLKYTMPFHLHSQTCDILSITP